MKAQAAEPSLLGEPEGHTQLVSACALLSVTWQAQYKLQSRAWEKGMLETGV